MPKISVHLEADSAEEFRALLAAFQFKQVQPQAAPEPDRAAGPKKEALNPVLTTSIQDVTLEASQGPSEAEQPATEAKEPAQPRRGRPRKEKTAERAGDTAGEAAGVVLPVPGVVHEDGQAKAEAAPEAKPEPVKAKPKPMPHAQPENGAATRQDLLDAFSEYVQRYGASFGFSDISQLLQKNLGDGVRKASDVPEDKLPVAIGAIKSAINDNPFNRKRDYA